MQEDFNYSDIMPKAKKTEFTSKDKVISVSVFVAGYIGVNMFMGEPRLGISVIYTLFSAIFFLYISKPLKSYSRVGLFLIASGFVLSLSFFFNSNTSFYPFNILLCMGFTLFGWLSSSGLNSVECNRPQFISISILDVFILLFSNFNKIFIASASISKNKKINKVIIGLLITFPIAIIVLALLSSADEHFERFGTSILNTIIKDPIAFFVKLFFTALFAAVIYSFLFTLRKSEKLSSANYMIKMKQNDGVILSTILSVLCVIYAVFDFMQFNYLWTIPIDESYSSYARRGFFELAIVTAINLTLILFTVTYSKKHIIIKILNCLLLSFTLIILASAVYRMLLYVSVYGLTVLRFWVLWIELIMAICIVLSFVKTIKPEFKVFPIMACSTIVLYLALNLCNMDSIIAHYNVNQYLDGKIKDFDSLYLSEELSYNDTVGALRKIPNYLERDISLIDNIWNMTIHNWVN